MFIFEYDYEDNSYPLSHSHYVALPTGAAGQEDAIVQSAISATGVVGKNALRRYEREVKKCEQQAQTERPKT